LQHEQLRKSQGIDYQVNPPIQVPSQYKDAAKSRLPGGIMFVDATSPGGGVRSAFEVNLNMQHLLEDIVDVRQRINGAYYADLFMMLANDTRSGVTATEVAERHEEKMLMIGPVLERLHDELLKPMIDITFDYCVDAGILPPSLRWHRHSAS
jgi:Bacteriophage head to tail connecting protein